MCGVARQWWLRATDPVRVIDRTLADVAALVPDLPRWPAVALFLAGPVILRLRIAVMLATDTGALRWTDGIADESGQGAV